MFTISMMIPAVGPWVAKATPIAAIAPMVAPTSGTRSNTPIRIASAAA